VRLLVENFLHFLLNAGHAGHPADQNDFVNVFGRHAGIFQRRLAWTDHLINQLFNQGFQLGAGQFYIQMFRTGSIRGDKRQVDIGFHGRGKLHLGFFRRFFQALQGHLVVS